MNTNTDGHTCSYYCERPECVRRQRDELRDRMESALASAPPSAPVGVEWPLSLLRAEHWREVYIGRRCMRLEVTYDYATWERLMAEVESALAQQPAAVGEEIMVNAAHDVFTLPLQSSGLSSGPRFVVHVPAPEQQPAAVDEAKETDLWRCTVCGRVGTVGRCCGEETREPLRRAAENERLREELVALKKASQGGGR